MINADANQIQQTTFRRALMTNMQVTMCDISCKRRRYFSIWSLSDRSKDADIAGGNALVDATLELVQTLKIAKLLKRQSSKRTEVLKVMNDLSSEGWRLWRLSARKTLMTYEFRRIRYEVQVLKIRRQIPNGQALKILKTWRLWRSSWSLNSCFTHLLYGASEVWRQCYR